jgi:hypothetical protein
LLQSVPQLRVLKFTSVSKEKKLHNLTDVLEPIYWPHLHALVMHQSAVTVETWQVLLRKYHGQLTRLSIGMAWHVMPQQALLDTIQRYPLTKLVHLSCTKNSYVTQPDELVHIYDMFNTEDGHYTSNTMISRKRTTVDVVEAILRNTPLLKSLELSRFRTIELQTLELISRLDRLETLVLLNDTSLAIYPSTLEMLCSIPRLKILRLTYRNSSHGLNMDSEFIKKLLHQMTFKHFHRFIINGVPYSRLLMARNKEWLGRGSVQLSSEREGYTTWTWFA